MPQERINILDLHYKGSCIYIIQNIDNSKVYIGSTKCYRKRLNEHKNDLVKGFHVNKHLQRSYNKGNNFMCSIVQKVDLEELIDKERYYCNFYNSYNKEKGYNLLKPEQTPTFNMTPEHLLILQKARAEKGYDTSHLRNPSIVKLAAEGKHKSVLVFKNGIKICEASSTIQAEEMTGVKRQNVSTICRGIRKSVRGYSFKYVINE